MRHCVRFFEIFDGSRSSLNQNKSNFQRQVRTQANPSHHVKMKIFLALFGAGLSQKISWGGKCPDTPLIADFDVEKVEKINSYSQFKIFYYIFF